MNSFYVVAALALLSGLGLMGAAHVMPADDCTPGYSFTPSPTDRPATVAFADRSPETREAFERALAEDESGFVRSGVFHDELEGEVVRYEGENYSIRTEGVGSCGDDPRAFVYIGGGIVAVSSVFFAAIGAFGTLLRRYS